MGTPRLHMRTRWKYYAYGTPRLNLPKYCRCGWVGKKEKKQARCRKSGPARLLQRLNVAEDVNELGYPTTSTVDYSLSTRSRPKLTTLGGGDCGSTIALPPQPHTTVSDSTHAHTADQRPCSWRVAPCDANPYDSTDKQTQPSRDAEGGPRPPPAQALR